MTGWPLGQTAIVLLLALAMGVSNVSADEIIFETRPEPGVSVRIVRQPNHDFWLRQPFGYDIKLQRPGGRSGLGMGPPELREIDFDFDGHMDIAVDFPEARSHDVLQIIRYRPEQRHYETLRLPQAPELHCDWRDAVPDPQSRLLTLDCRRGVWSITETVRFNRFGAPWLEKRLTEGGLGNAERYPYVPIASRFSRWDEMGEQVALAARDRGGNSVFMTIPAPRASLYEHPTHSAQTARYLVRGDRVEVLDQLEDWLFVRHEGQSGTIERWLWMEDAFDLAARFGLDAPGDHGLVLSGNDMSGSLADIFPITLTNKGANEQKLDRPELHMIFDSQKHGAFWAHTLGSRAPATIAPGESLILEEGPPFFEYGTYFLPHPMPNEFETSVELFPFDLAPGDYHFRLAVTSPGLEAPIYAEDTYPFPFPLPGPQDALLENPDD